jgi:hypothetical protein
MSAFAAGERYINRVRSASTDGYVDEVRNYLDRATLQLREARALFVKLQQRICTINSLSIVKFSLFDAISIDGKVLNI